MTVGFNLLLLLDFYVLPATTYPDVIARIDIIRARHINQSDMQLTTGDGRHWLIAATGYELAGHEISYQKSAVFSIAYEIYNVTTSRAILRTYSPFLFVPLAAAAGLLLGITGLLMRRGSHKQRRIDAVQYCLMFLAIELVFILI